MPSHAWRHNILAGPYLERAAHWRNDPARLRAALTDPATLFLPVWQAASPVRVQDGAFSAHLLAGADAFTRLNASQCVLLGEFHGQLCFAVELEQPPEQALRTAIQFHDLRSIAGELPAEEAGLLAYARAMIHWRGMHRYCGRCGARNGISRGGHAMACSNPACGAQQFPRIDPAIIVLVTHGERALLGRQASWPPGRYSTLAGFVEPGESLEDAVHREVQEETGVTVDTVQYHSSQPWPFPASLMLGFTATTRNTHILPMDDELEDARWFTREDIATGAVCLPTPHSISFRLIEDWYNQAGNGSLREAPGVRLWQQSTRRQ